MACNTIVTLYPYQGMHEHSWRGADKVIESEKNANIKVDRLDDLSRHAVNETLNSPTVEYEPIPGETPSPFSPPEHGERPGGPRLELRWDMERKSRFGVFIGASESLCDIVIPEHRGCFKGVSSVQGLFSFDGQNRLTYQDVRSPDRVGDGSSVSYGGQGKDEIRRGFTWILSGTDYLDRKKPEIILRLHKRLHFRVVVTEYLWSGSDYIEAVNGFKQQPGTADESSSLSLSHFSLEDKSITALASGAQTYSRGAVLIENGVLGSGSFGTVTCLYDVTKGIYIARKQPRTDVRALTTRVKLEWENEIRLLKRVDEAAAKTSEACMFSQHVVRIIDGAVDPVPHIDLEYMPLGSLYEVHHKHGLTRLEVISVFDQMLQALVFLHGLKPQVAHRDIKPSNILVQHRDGGFAPFGVAEAKGIVVKLADFGLSKDETLRTVEIGTRRYMAPELCDDIARTVPGTRRPSYSTAVDIWALGVSIYELAYPCRFPNEAGFSEYVRSTVSLTQGDIAELIAEHMVVLNPRNRSSARNILVYLRNGLMNGSPEAQYMPIAQTPSPAQFSTYRGNVASGYNRGQTDSNTSIHMRADNGPLPQLRPARRARVPAGPPSESSRNGDQSQNAASNENRTARPRQPRQTHQSHQSHPPPPATQHAYNTRSRSSLTSAVASSSQQSGRSTQDDTPRESTASHIPPSASDTELTRITQAPQPNLELLVREGSGNCLEIDIGFDDSRSQFSESTDSRGSSTRQHQRGQQVQQQALTHAEAQALQNQTPRSFARPSGSTQGQHQGGNRRPAVNARQAPPHSDSSFVIEDIFRN